MSGTKKDIFKNSIQIPLHNFKYLHHTHRKSDSENIESDDFLGRKKQLSRLLSILNDKNSAKGAYLVTGYRGCGKTSFINKAICLYKHESRKKPDKFIKKIKLYYDNIKNKKMIEKKIYTVKLNLANDKSLDSHQIYKRMAQGLLNKVSKHSLSKKVCNYTYEITAILAITLGLLYNELLRVKGLDIELEKTFDILRASTTLTGSLYTLLSAILAISTIKIIKEKLCHTNLQKLIEDIENETKTSFKINGPFNFSRNITKRKLEAPDIEQRLNDILNSDYGNSNKYDIIFIFDELDKIRAPKDKYGNNKKRIEQVDKLLGSLKNIVSENSARFIFIGGRDMHDAYLSQSGAVSSLYQSIFNQSIYIPTLLSDDSDHEKFRINSMIEKFCMSFILPKTPKSDCIENLTVEEYSKKISSWREKAGGVKKESDEEYIMNSFFILRNFINYLTLNSKGNYKILLSIFDSFVHKDAKNYLSIDYEIPNYIKNPSNKKPAIYYLNFDIKEIQKILLSSNLYISFHYHLSRRLRHADDKVVVASVSMLQFIIKFYNKGFSRRHLYNTYDSISSANRCQDPSDYKLFL